MKYSFFFTCTKPIDILGLGFVDYETTIQGSKKKILLTKSFEKA
jgi:hypothetical protein